MFSRKHHATAAPRLGSNVSPTRLRAVHTPTVQRLADEQPNQRYRRRYCSAAIACSMCNLYSQTKGQQAIIALTKSMRDSVGNLPPLPGIFPDYSAPIVRTGTDGVRRLTLVRWGLPSPAFAPDGKKVDRVVTSLRRRPNPHWPRGFGPSPTW